MSLPVAYVNDGNCSIHGSSVYSVKCPQYNGSEVTPKFDTRPSTFIVPNHSDYIENRMETVVVADVPYHVPEYDVRGDQTFNSLPPLGVALIVLLIAAYMEKTG